MDDAKKIFSEALEAAPDGIVIVDLDGRIMYSNRAMEKLYGYAPEELVGRHLGELDEDPGFSEQAVIPAVHETGLWVGEMMVKHKRGRAFPSLLNIALVRNEAGEPIAMVGIVRDITERKHSEEELRRSERFLNTIFDSIRDPFSIMDRNYRIIRLNEAYAQMKGKSVDSLIGKRCYEVLGTKGVVCDGCVIEKTFHSGDPCAKDKHIILANGSDAWVEIYTYPILDDKGRVSHVIEYTRDITDRKRSEEEKQRLIEKLEHLSKTDGLTGLLNRRALTERLSYEIDRAKRYGSDLSLVLCDVDNFKQINDLYGHAGGDSALQNVSGTLKGMLRKTDIAGRYGGDEFIMILPETSMTGAVSLAEKIRASIESSEFRLEGDKTARMSLSIGVTCLAAASDTIDSFVKRADDAMYASKQSGRNKVSSVPS